MTSFHERENKWMSKSAYAKRRVEVVRLLRQGMSQSQVAAELGIPVGSVSSAVRKARQRGEIAQSGYGPPDPLPGQDSLF